MESKFRTLGGVLIAAGILCILFFTLNLHKEIKVPTDNEIPKPEVVENDEIIDDEIKTGPKNLGVAPDEVPQSSPSVITTKTAWLWESPDVFNETELIKMFQIARDENISTIYIRMDDFSYIYGIKDPTLRSEKISKLSGAARKFIKIAKNYNINVEALGGDTTWAEPSGLMYPRRFFDAIIEYNNTNPDAQFTGIQFDVEVNNSSAYKSNKTGVLTQYLDFAQEMAEKNKNYNSTHTKKDFSLGFAIPFWYDNENNNGVILDWKNYGDKPVAYHLFDLLSRIKGGYVVIMDYRNYAEGADGSIAHALDEFEYVSKNNLELKILIGQETTKVSPSKITFFDTDKKYFKSETSKILQTFSHYPEFGGIAIHHLPSYIDL